jgi:hypothetical protein
MIGKREVNTMPRGAITRNELEYTSFIDPGHIKNDPAAFSPFFQFFLISWNSLDLREPP